MKANKMPERVYLFDYNDAMVTPLEGDTTYVREDAFIEKAEDRYLEHFQDGRLRNCSSKEAFLLGYHQAEKDLELGWEDLKLLQDLYHEVFAEVVKGSVDFYQIYPTEQSYLEEVLKRFKDFRERKEK